MGILKSYEIKFSPAEGASRGWRFLVQRDDYEQARRLLMEDAQKKGTYWIWFDKDTIIQPHTSSWEERPQVAYNEALVQRRYSGYMTMGMALRRTITEAAAQEFPMVLRVASHRNRTANQDLEEIVEIELGQRGGQDRKTVRYKIRQVNDNGNLTEHWTTVE